MPTVDIVRRVTVEGRAPGVNETTRALTDLGRAARTTALAVTGAATAIGGAAVAAGGHVATALGSAGAAGQVTLLDRIMGSAAVRIVGRFTAIGAAALTAYQAIAFIRRQTNNELEELNRIGNAANDAGLSTTIFQAFTGQAQRLRVEVGDLESALRTFRDNTRESLANPVSTLRGRLNELAGFGFGNDPTLNAGRQRFEAARTGDERLRETLRIMVELERQGRRLEALDIAENAFGAGRLTERLRDGRVSMAEFAQEAQRANEAVASPDTIRRAQDLQERYERASNTLANAFRPVLQDIVALGVPILSWGAQLTELVAEAARQASLFYRWMSGIVQLGVGGAVQRDLRAALAEADRILSNQGIPQAIRDAAQGGADRAAFGLGDQQLGSQLRDRAAALRGGGRPNIDRVWSGGAPVPLPPDLPPDWVQIRDRFTRQREAGAGRTAREGDAFTRAVATAQGRTQALREEIALLGQGAGAVEAMRLRIELETTARRHGITLTAEQTAQIAREVEARRQVAQALAQERAMREARYERGLLGLADEEVQIARRLRDVYGDDIPRALASAEAAALRMNDALRQTRDLGGEFFGGIASSLAGGARLTDALSKGLSRLAGQLAEMAGRQLWQQAFGAAIGGPSGSGPGLFGLLASLLGGSLNMAASGPGVGNIGGTGGWFASGGYTGPGGRFEPAGIVHRGEYVFSQEKTRAFRPLFDAIHQGRLPGYDRGGLVAPFDAGPLVEAAVRGGGEPAFDRPQVVLNIDARGAGPREVEILRAEMPRIAVQAVQKAMRDRVM